MEDEEDSLRVVGRVAKRDKDGNEITNESLGRGGARREDGTLSALVFDLETLPDDDDSPPYDDETSTEAAKLSPEQQLELFELFVRFLEVTVPVVQKFAPL